MNEKDEIDDHIEIFGGSWLEPSTIALILAIQQPPWYLRFVPNGVSNWRAKQKLLIEEYEIESIKNKENKK